MREYRIRFTGEQDFILLSPEMIAALIDRVRCSPSPEMTVSVQELSGPEYARYLAHTVRANLPENSPQTVESLLARQIGELSIDCRPCFDEAEVRLQRDGAQLNLKAEERFFRIAKRSDSRFICSYPDGEEVILVLEYP